MTSACRGFCVMLDQGRAMLEKSCVNLDRLASGPRTTLSWNNHRVEFPHFSRQLAQCKGIKSFLRMNFNSDWLHDELDWNIFFLAIALFWFTELPVYLATSQFHLALVKCLRTRVHVAWQINLKSLLLTNIQYYHNHLNCRVTLVTDETVAIAWSEYT